jgi:DNA-binding NarL/FixJ family response regulator
MMDMNVAAVMSTSSLMRDGVLNSFRHAGVNAAEGFRKVGDLLEALDAHRMDLVLVDLEHLPDDPRVVLQAVRRHPSQPRVIVVGTPIQLAAADSYCDAELETQGADVETLSQCVIELTRREGAPQRFRHRTRDEHVPAKEDPREWSRVTTRQREVLGWLSQGADNDRISKILHISVRTVKAHVSSLMRRFEVENRTELALLASEVGIRPPPWDPMAVAAQTLLSAPPASMMGAELVSPLA